jgi:hypothetical protein
MTNPMIRIHDIESGKVIDREMTAAEFEIYKADVAAMESDVALREEKKIAKAALLERLGITEDEAKLLLA